MKINLNIDVTIEKNNDIYRVVVTDGKAVNEMPARTLDEAKQVAIATAAPFVQFVLGQELSTNNLVAR